MTSRYRRGAFSRPPALARLLLRLVLPERDREFVLRDLDEEFVQLVEGGATRDEARRWYRSQVVGSIIPSLQRNRRQVGQRQRNNIMRVETVLQDLSFGMRLLHKHPGLSLAAIVTFGSRRSVQWQGDIQLGE